MTSPPTRVTETSGPRSLAAGCLTILVLASCYQPAKTFRIELPDVTFVVDRDWVPPNIRAQAVHSFEVDVPRAQIPKDALAFLLRMQSETQGAQLAPKAYRLSFEYRDTSKDAFGNFERRPGWTLLPEITQAGYRVATEPDIRPGSAGPWMWYQFKAEPRYVVLCGALIDGRGNGKTLETCTVNVPYRVSADRRCTQIRISFPKREFDRWPELAAHYRAVLGQFEAAPGAMKQGT